MPGRYAGAVIGMRSLAGFSALGNWADVAWLRKEIGDPAVREWFCAMKGVG